MDFRLRPRKRGNYKRKGVITREKGQLEEKKRQLEEKKRAITREKNRKQLLFSIFKTKISFEEE
jgi:hypothetical protein